MSKYLDKAKEVRAITEVHYNCTQSVLVPFAEVIGLDEKAAFALGANFGAGMKMGATCGVITGGLMVLGMLGIDDMERTGAFKKAIRENHAGHLDCKDLLKMNAEAGGDKKQHCDGMVYEAVELLEKILRESGKIE